MEVCSKQWNGRSEDHREATKTDEAFVSFSDGGWSYDVDV